jgi:hypothetical protein
MSLRIFVDAHDVGTTNEMLGVGVRRGEADVEGVGRGVY